MTFEQAQQAIVAVAFIAGLVPFAVMVRRVPMTIWIMKRLESAAAGFLKEAQYRFQLNEEHVISIHDGLLALAIMTPSIVIGDYFLPKKPSDETNMAKVEAMLNDNLWVIPYLTVAYLCSDVTSWLARPFDPRTWTKAIPAIWLLRRYSTADGSFGMTLKRGSVTIYSSVREAEVRQANSSGMFGGDSRPLSHA